MIIIHRAVQDDIISPCPSHSVSPCHITPDAACMTFLPRYLPLNTNDELECEVGVVLGVVLGVVVVCLALLPGSNEKCCTLGSV